VANFDRDQLAAILSSARIEPRNKTINKLDSLLTFRQIGYWISRNEIIGKKGPSPELLNLHKSLKDWIALVLRDLKNKNDPFPSLYELPIVIDEYDDNDKYNMRFDSIMWLFNTTNKAIGLLEREKPNRPIHPKEAETYLFRRLYDDYCDLKGDKTISDTGPQIRFVTGCAKMIDPNIIVPKRLRQRLSYYYADNKLV
jgi:hypothetical protein